MSISHEVHCRAFTALVKDQCNAPAASWRYRVDPALSPSSPTPATGALPAFGFRAFTRRSCRDLRSVSHLASFARHWSSHVLLAASRRYSSTACDCCRASTSRLCASRIWSSTPGGTSSAWPARSGGGLAFLLFTVSGTPVTNGEAHQRLNANGHPWERAGEAPM